MERINLKGKVRKFLLIIFTNLASLIKRKKLFKSLALIHWYERDCERVFNIISVMI